MFDHILAQAYHHDFIKAAHIDMDSTHIKANANKRKSNDVMVTQERKIYQDALDQECDRYSEEQGLSYAIEVTCESKRIKQSSVDPQSGHFHQDEHKKQFAYSAQTTCNQHGFILGVHVDAGNHPDSKTFYPAFSKVHEVFGQNIRSVGVDAGYKTPLLHGN